MMIERMDATFERLKWDEDAVVPRDFLRAAMRTDDLEMQGTAYQFLATERGTARVTPPLAPGELNEFAERYLGRCLREDPLADDFLAQRSCTRYGAGWELVRWYVRLFKATPGEADALAGLRAMLASAYREGDAGVRAAVVNVTLSHLFASVSVRRTFAEWLDAPDLREAYAAALDGPARRAGLRAKRSVQPLTKKSRTAIRT